MPFLRLTRDRRGIENTYLLHSDHAGGRPRLLYWYRTAPGIALGRPALDEEAIHTIEDNHPDIEFDWPAILALSEVMTPEDEVVPARPRRKPKRDREAPLSPPERPADELDTATSTAAAEEVAADDQRAEPDPGVPAPPGLLEELVGREIATRLRARYAEIRTIIYEKESDEAARDRRLGGAEPLNPDGWATAEAILDGVRNADALFERLKGELLNS